jgi:choline dehydrogenase
VLRIPKAEWRETDHAFHAACLAAGFADETDINRPDTEGGVGMLPLNNVTSDSNSYRGLAENRVRQSSALTYLAAARGRPNLAVQGDALVARVVFDTTGATPRATGVELVDGTVLSAKREVMSAGTHASISATPVS